MSAEKKLDQRYEHLTIAALGPNATSNRRLHRRNKPTDGPALTAAAGTVAGFDDALTAGKIAPTSPA